MSSDPKHDGITPEVLDRIDAALRRGDLDADRSKVSDAVVREIKKVPDAAVGYDHDARAIARVLVKFYGDEAEAVVDRIPTFLEQARLERRRRK